MNKPYKIVELKTPKDTELVDNLFSIIFSNMQNREVKTLEFVTTGVWPVANMLAEKEIVFAVNAVDGVRLYTKVAGIVRYIAFT